MNDEAPKPDEPEPDDEPETFSRRRRVRLSYRSAERSMMADQIMIVMALAVALFMVYSRGCQSSLDGLGKVLTEQNPASPDASVPEP